MAAMASNHKDAMMKFDLVEEPIHVGKTALYLTDLEIGDINDLFDRFKEGLCDPVHKMLPFSDWCLTSMVRHQFVVHWLSQQSSHKCLYAVGKR